MSDKQELLFIKIMEAPSGEAPFWVRQAWIGLVLLVVLFELREGQTMPASFGGYPVNYLVAIGALEAHGRLRAAQWWREHCDLGILGQNFTFNDDCCEEIRLAA